MLQVVFNGRAVVVDDEERQECEIWTRVMGYYRPIESFNVGKRQEFEDRVYFNMSEKT